ncbi:hypothetical protein BBJ28_00010499 [Nothophytophthora sp. Chile5]|nr:hypothetical protein BBJ28_00010499 [Nothophytophthora sp. Chile5]
MLRAAVLRAQRAAIGGSDGRLLALTRQFSGLSVAPSGPSGDDSEATRKEQAAIIEGINRRFSIKNRGRQLSTEALDRTVTFFMDFGIHKTKALKIIWLRPLVTAAATALARYVASSSSCLALTPSVYMSLFLVYCCSVDCPQQTRDDGSQAKYAAYDDRIPYLFATFPSAMACNMENTLDPKMEVLKHAGLDVTQIMRVLSRSPSIFNMSADSLEANILAFRKLGIPDESMAQFIANTPTALTLSPENIEKHLALLRKFYGSEAVMKRLLASPAFLLHNTHQLQMAFDFLVAKGFTPERLSQLGTKLVMRTVDGILQPRAEFLESIDADLLANTSWITDSRTMFIRRYPDFPEYEAYTQERIDKVHAV